MDREKDITKKIAKRRMAKHIWKNLKLRHGNLGEANESEQLSGTLLNS